MRGLPPRVSRRALFLLYALVLPGWPSRFPLLEALRGSGEHGLLQSLYLATSYWLLLAFVSSSVNWALCS